MNSTSDRIAILPGEGMVQHTPTTLAVVGNDGDQDLAAEILEWASDEATSDQTLGEWSSTNLLGRLTSDRPQLGALRFHDGIVDVILLGAVSATLSTAGEELVFVGGHNSVVLHTFTGVLTEADLRLNTVAGIASVASSELSDDDTTEGAGLVYTFADEAAVDTRPPLGVLTNGSGQEITVDGDLVLGRHPGGDAAVIDLTARPVEFDEEDLAVSRVHARIELVDLDAFVIDSGSNNGTHFRAAGTKEFRQLDEGERQLLADGDAIQLGSQVLQYEPV